MTDLETTFHWLLWQRLPGLGPNLARRLLTARGLGPTPRDWLALPSRRLDQLGLSEQALASIAEWRRAGRTCPAALQAAWDLDWLQRQGADLIAIGDPRYPALLQEIADPPPWLYVWGDTACLDRPQLAVVGSRRPTRQGVIEAETFATALAAAGFTITSGLAYGIDGAAHRGALAAGGTTLAVLGTGLDVLYPAQHGELAESVRGHGALVTEFPLGTQPRAAFFPQRNRIISGLSLGVLVVEAALRSGSLVTARLALEQNRELFALPGSPRNPTSRGCNALIRQGAILVEGVEDVLAELRGWSQPTALPAVVSERAPTPALGVEAGAVLAAIGTVPVDIDQLAEQVGLPLPALLAALSELELLGLVENRAGAWLRVGG